MKIDDEVYLNKPLLLISLRPQFKSEKNHNAWEIIGNLVVFFLE